MPDPDQKSTGALARLVDDLAPPNADTNLPFSTIDGEDLMADLFLPSDSSHPPVVVLVPGRSAEPEDDSRNSPMFRDWATLFASKGLATLIYGQRNTGGLLSGRFQLREDLQAAMNFLIEQETVDSTRLALFGFSGGVPNSVSVAFGSDGVRCAVCYYGPMHLEAYRERLPDDAPEAARNAIMEFSAQHRLTVLQGSIPPTLVVRAGKESQAHIKSSIDDFVHEALRLNAPLTLVNIPNAPHGFDGLDGSKEAVEAILTTIKFLKFHLS